MRSQPFENCINILTIRGKFDQVQLAAPEVQTELTLRLSLLDVLWGWVNTYGSFLLQSLPSFWLSRNGVKGNSLNLFPPRSSGVGWSGRVSLCFIPLSKWVYVRSLICSCASLPSYRLFYYPFSLHDGWLTLFSSECQAQEDISGNIRKKENLKHHKWPCTFLSELGNYLSIML